MLLRNFVPAILGLALITSGGAARCQQNQYSGIVLTSPAGQATAVLFRYFPPGNAIHYPLVIRAVDQGDPRLNTSPMAAECLTAYISLDEMSQLTRAVARLSLSWRESEKIEILPSFRELPTDDIMNVQVVGSKGTAKAEVRPSRICETLKPLDSAIKTQRALWEFQGFRLNY